MRLRIVLNYSFLAFAAGAALSVSRASAQERPAKRVASIVGVAIEEYAKGIDDKGVLISQTEYDEAVGFLSEARETASRLSGERADSARIALDAIVVGMREHVPPNGLAELQKTFDATLGAEGALDMPSRTVDLVAGRRTYESSCASCHGTTGMGDGPLARTIHPEPPALGDAATMRDRTPALQYRIVSVGVSGTPMAPWANTLTPDQRWNVVWYLHALRARGPLAEGEGLFMQRCAGCHGATGASDGALSAALTKLPAELSSFAWQAERSDAQLAAAIREGSAGTAMPPAPDLRDGDVQRLVAFVRMLPLHDAPGRGPAVASAGSLDGECISRAVLATLDDALGALRGGRKTEAADKAFDAYIAFEPLETPARARNPGMVSTMERFFADFKGAIKSGDERTAEGSRNAIEAGLPTIVELTRPTEGWWGAFFESFLIILREGFEAILVIGAIVAFLLKTGHRERLHAIWTGVVGALVASGLTALVLATTLSALPASREIIEGVTMLIAVAVLFSVSYWLISKVEAARWQQFIREKVSAALEHGGGKALTFVAFLAVYREGAETALFYQALFNERTGTALPLALGIIVGAVALSIIFVLFYRYGVRIPLRPFFAVTSALLYYMALVFMGKGVRELQEGNVMPITVLPGWPHVEAMGIFPSVETLAAQAVLLLLFVFAMLKTFWPRRAVTLPTMRADAASADAQTAALTDRLAELEKKVDGIEAALAVEQRD